MIKIQPIPLGIPEQNGTHLLVGVTIANTQDKTCALNWRILTGDFKDLATGVIQLTEEQYSKWGDDNTYLEEITLETLKLNRL